MVTFPFSTRNIKNFPVIYYNNIEEPWGQTHGHLGFPCDWVPLPSFTLEFVYINLQQCISGQQLGPCLALALTVVSTQLNCEALTQGYKLRVQQLTLWPHF